MIGRYALLVLLTISAACSAHAEKAWREKTDCRWVDNPSNDGDSFHVKTGRREYIFRLLFVDCPETDKSLPERVAEQAAYWGITADENIKVGKEAQRFTREFLQNGFTVFTQFEDAMGRSAMGREYAMVSVGKTDLAVALVSNGLARIFGRQEMPDEGPSEMTMRFRLKSAEMDARKNRRGAWAYVDGARPGSLRTPAPAAAEQTRTTDRRTPVYVTNDPGRVLGYLSAGKSITVLGTQDVTRVRVRFTVSDGSVYEGLCQRADLGL